MVCSGNHDRSFGSTGAENFCSGTSLHISWFTQRCNVTNILFQKWRKRYFVLYAPPTVEGIPDAYTAILEYYTSKKQNHKCGSIDLSRCEEVLSSLQSDLYQYVFGLQTYDKNLSRTYYLVADTEIEMNKWVNYLCRVLGMTENGKIHCNFPQKMYVLLINLISV